MVTIRSLFGVAPTIIEAYIDLMSKELNQKLSMRKSKMDVL